MSQSEAARSLLCPYCKEPLPAAASVCPHCDESLVGPRAGGPKAPRGVRDLVAATLAGVACGAFLLGVATRVFATPLEPLAAAARSLRFLELVLSAIFLLLLAGALRRREP